MWRAGSILREAYAGRGGILVGESPAAPGLCCFPGEHSSGPSPPLPCSHLRVSQKSTIQTPPHLFPAPTSEHHRRAQSRPLPTSPLLPPQGVTALHLGHHSKARNSPPPLPPQCGPMYSKLFPPTTHSTPKTRRRGSSTQYPRSQGPRAFQTVLTCWEPCQPAVWAGQGGSPRGLISCTHSASQLLRLSTPSWDATAPLSCALGKVLCINVLTSRILGCFLTDIAHCPLCQL